MTLYAASHLVWVGVSADHGGCGEGHGRPVENGAPAKLWALDCPPCEDHLRHDPHWSATISEIPETHDERIQREDFDKRGVLDERRLMAMALARLTGLELPDTIATALKGTLPNGAAAQMICPGGHANAPGQKFCGECGTPMHGAPADRQVAPPSSPQGTRQEPGEPPAPAGPGLMDLHPQKLRKMCRDAGVDDRGTKAQMAARLRPAQGA